MKGKEVNKERREMKGLKIKEENEISMIPKLHQGIEFSTGMAEHGMQNFNENWS